MLTWIHGSEASAVRIHQSAQWIITPKQEAPEPAPTPGDPRLNKPSLFLGLLLQLRYLKRQSYLRSSSSQAFFPARETNAHKVLFAIALCAIGLTVVISSGYGIWDLASRHSAQLIPLLQIPLAFWITWVFLQIAEWLFLKKAFPKATLLEWDILSPKLHRVAWDLSPLSAQALGVLLIQTATAALSFYFLAQGSLIAGGVFLAAWCSLLLALSPFESGPGSHLYHALLGSERIIQLQDQFLAALLDPASSLKGKISPKTVIAGIFLVSWLWLAPASFQWFQDLLNHQSSLSMLAFQATLNIAGLFFSIWLLYQLIAYVRSSALLRSPTPGIAFSPSAKDLELWKKSCALLAHIPELAHLPWKWQWMPPGSQLIRKDDPAEHFYWLASGEAVVIGLSADRKNTVFAELHAGSGIGEIAFLRGSPRTASVYIRKSAVVASIHRDAFASIRTAEIVSRLEHLVLASQTMDLSRMFRSMPSHAKELWLCHGKIFSADTGEKIIERGSSDTWMGMIINGSIQVERNGNRVAVLGRGHVFGEIALWTNTERQATLYTLEPVVYMRWEPEFWSQEAKRHGLEKYLNELVRQRMADLENI